MKKIMTLIVFFLLIASTTNAQTLKKLFDKYSNDERFEYVSIGKGLLTMTRIFGDTDEDTLPILSKIKGLKMLTLTDGFDDTLQKAVIKEVDLIVRVGNFETLVEVRDKTERVNVYCQINEKDDADMFVLTKDESELTLIWIKGKLSVDELMIILDN